MHILSPILGLQKQGKKRRSDYLLTCLCKFQAALRTAKFKWSAVRTSVLRGWQTSPKPATQQKHKHTVPQATPIATKKYTNQLLVPLLLYESRQGALSTSAVVAYRLYLTPAAEATVPDAASARHRLHRDASDVSKSMNNAKLLNVFCGLQSCHLGGEMLENRIVLLSKCTLLSSRRSRRNRSP